MNNITTVFSKSMKMSDLIDADYQLLLLLMRLDISLGFGEKSVDSVCRQSNFDPDCFIFLANFQSGMSKVNMHEEFDKLPLEPFLFYLKKSHTYFLEDRLPGIRQNLKIIFANKENIQQEVVLGFFDNYMQEVSDHMVYENEVVFPYVRSLISQKNTDKYSIKIFEKRHNNIDEKVNDLKRILMKYISGIENQKLMTNILIELYMTQEELEKHTFIEDNLIIPRVKKIEGKG
ncbi:hemerythrin domain-containing protein [Viscerimonas tarda]